MNLVEIFDNRTTTTNGATAYNSTMNPLVDLLYKVGIYKPHQHLNDLFIKALKQNTINTLALLFYSRDILKGLGVRVYFREVMLMLLINAPTRIQKNLLTVLVELINTGSAYWDDFFYLYENILTRKLSIKKDFTKIAHEYLEKRDQLFLKWFPRKGLVQAYLYKTYGAKNLRKILTSYVTTETLVSAKKFNEINYAHVPGKSFIRHKNAFEAHDYDNFHRFLDRAQKGEVKINAKTVTPVELMRSVRSNPKAVNAQWKNLPDIVPAGKSFLPVIDLSGSMTMNDSLPIDTAVSLGLYLAERNKSIFKDRLITFSHNAYWTNVQHNGDVVSMYETLVRNGDVANTDLEQVFNLILSTAMQHKVAQADLPTHLIIITDGQFDEMVDNGDTIQKAFKEKFKAAGYTLPNIVFWNVAGSNNVPAIYNEEGIALISGSSVHALTAALSGATPEEALEQAIAPYIDLAKQVVK